MAVFQCHRMLKKKLDGGLGGGGGGSVLVLPATDTRFIAETRLTIAYSTCSWSQCQQH